MSRLMLDLIERRVFTEVKPKIFAKDWPVVSNGRGGGEKQVVKACAQSHIHNVDRHFASPNVVISLQIICLPLDGCGISTQFSTIFPSVLTAPNFIALCQSGPGNYRYRHTSSPLQRNNQHSLCAACGHTAPKLSPGSLSKTITPLSGPFYTSNLEAQEGFGKYRGVRGVFAEVGLATVSNFFRTLLQVVFSGTEVDVLERGTGGG